jgi:cytidine deaminase
MWQISSFTVGAAEADAVNKVVTAINAHAASATGGMARKQKDDASSLGL